MDKIIYSILWVKNNNKGLNALLAGIKGISGADVYAVSFDEIAAVVGDIARAGLIADKPGAIKYAEVIEKLSQQYALLPMRYGSVVESTDVIKNMLERNYNEIRDNLLKVENKVEYGLKVFCDSEKLKAELKAKKETGQEPEPEQNSEKSIYMDYLNKKLKEHRFEEMLLAHVDTIIQDISTHLTRLNPVHKFKKMVSPANIIDAVFLLEKENTEGLISAVKDLQNRYASFHLLLTGPWPPYNFVEISIK